MTDRLLVLSTPPPVPRGKSATYKFTPLSIKQAGELIHEACRSKSCDSLISFTETLEVLDVISGSRVGHFDRRQQSLPALLFAERRRYLCVMLKDERSKLGSSISARDFYFTLCEVIE